MSSANALNTPTKNENDFFSSFHLKFNTFFDLQERPLHAACTFFTPYVCFIIISRLWHSEGTAGHTQDVNIWASVFWGKRDVSSALSANMKVFCWHFSQFLEIFDRGFTLHCHCVVESSGVDLSSAFWKANVLWNGYRHQGWVKKSKVRFVPVGFWWSMIDCKFGRGSAPLKHDIYYYCIRSRSRRPLLSLCRHSKIAVSSTSNGA